MQLTALVGKTVLAVKENICPKTGLACSSTIYFTDGTTVTFSAREEDGVAWVNQSFETLQFPA